MSRYNTAGEIIKEIYGPVIKAQLERELRMHAVFTISSVEDVITRLHKLRSKRHWFMSKNTKYLIYQAQNTLEAYNCLYPRYDIAGSVRLRMTKNPD